jgi:hypothetical protein
MVLAARASHQTDVVGWLGRAAVVLIGAAWIVFTDLSVHRGGDMHPHPLFRRAAHEPA